MQTQDTDASARLIGGSPALVEVSRRERQREFLRRHDEDVLALSPDVAERRFRAEVDRLCGMRSFGSGHTRQLEAIKQKRQGGRPLAPEEKAKLHHAGRYLNVTPRHRVERNLRDGTLLYLGTPEAIAQFCPTPRIRQALGTMRRSARHRRRRSAAQSRSRSPGRKAGGDDPPPPLAQIVVLAHRLGGAQ